MKTLLNLLKAYYFFGKNVHYERKITQKFVALTFDDGPHPIDDTELLDILDKHGVKATFFLCGKHVRDLQAETREISRRGHEIGNHSFSHDWSVTIPLSKSSIQREILQTNTLIKQITGKTPLYFRPPRLVQGKKISRVLREQDMISILASAFASDWKMQDDATAIFNDVSQMIRPGRIVVLHSGDAENPARRQERRDGTGKAVDKLLTHLKKEEYKVGTISDLFNI